MIVELIARTTLVPGAADRMGYIPHEPGTVSDGDELLEVAGRECYQSWGRKYPPTATNKTYLANIISKVHFSVMEHASYTFSIRGISRACSHELVRHRHLSPSMLSQRYVPESDSGAVTPPELVNNPGVVPDTLLSDAHQAAIEIYDKIVETLTEAGVPRKRARQAARYALPNGHETRLVLTGNVRAWREFIEKRTIRDPFTDEPLADLEICQLAERILILLHHEVPNAVQDLWEKFERGLHRWEREITSTEGPAPVPAAERSYTADTPVHVEVSRSLD